MMAIEQMSEFFTARVDSYDNHMLTNVSGCREGYAKMAEFLPQNVEKLLDLGCGTGLQLDEIFKIYPNIEVTGIDLTLAMLEQLRKKHPDKKLNLIHQSYFDYNFGISNYDAAISFQSLHHFTHNMKLSLYERVFKALTDNGVYIECDYMVENQSDEDHYMAENQKIRLEQGIKDGEFYHYDTPLTIDHQIMLLKQAGFVTVESVWRVENTTILVAKK